jgi:uncharacterized membrane protein
VHIHFDVPADPAYPGRVAAVLSNARLSKYTAIGAGLVAAAVLGLALARVSGWGQAILPLYTAMIVGGLLSMLYAPWTRLTARRRSSRYAVEGDYDITEDNIMMRSGSESGGIAWDGVSRVTDAGEFWIVYVGRVPATVIPRRLMSAGDAEELRAFMAREGLLEN